MERIVHSGIGRAALLATLGVACSAARPDANVPPPSDASVATPNDASVAMPGGDAGAVAPDLGSASEILVPAQGALLGHYYGAGTLAETDARIGRKPALHLVYY